MIAVEIGMGYHRCERVFLPIIPLEPSEIEKLSVAFRRTQFPLLPCFAMTINKAHGPTLEHVGVYFLQPVSSHGQLYVALSRAKTSASIKILAQSSTESLKEGCTRNAVHHEILSEARKV